ncbi:anti-sigma factor [Amycolatopsis cihanbeyliensis]|uniref:Regulator of SigK n=1 Tax=Amycolatopsis cihanbeyliensis TaxID=1128664 RepID=A0A542DHV4_AMYCI|nr:anti-sigma factor [Amycolatopsis cihanbeyliensis]TQJ02662.1 anti-sigma-K factor RskA [Amycolatopsis cihanbeyliensis]
MSTHMNALTGAYAVDALTGEERSEFERHLAECADCTREVRELREAAGRLGTAVATAPPEGLKRRVLDEVARTRQDPPETGVEPETGAEGVAEVVPLSRKRRWATRFAVAAAVAGLALAGTFGTIALQNQQELNSARERMEQATARGTEMSELLSAPDARLITASGEGGLTATTVVSARLGKAMFMGDHTAPLSEDRAYQLWFIRSGQDKFVSAGVLERSAAGRTTPVVRTIPEGTAWMGVTVEPAGGSAQPTTDPVLKMTVPA